MTNPLQGRCKNPYSGPRRGVLSPIKLCDSAHFLQVLTHEPPYWFCVCAREIELCPESYCALWAVETGIRVLGLLFYACNSICKRSVQLPPCLCFP